LSRFIFDASVTRFISQRNSSPCLKTNRQPYSSEPDRAPASSWRNTSAAPKGTGMGCPLENQPIPSEHEAHSDLTLPRTVILAIDRPEGAASQIGAGETEPGRIEEIEEFAANFYMHTLPNTELFG